VKEISVSFSSAMFKPFDAYALMEFNDMQKSMTKYYWADYVPIPERKLEYYWTSGATVTLNEDTGKFRLNYFTSSSGASMANGGSGKSYVNGLTRSSFTAAQRYAGNALKGIKSALGGF